MRAVKAGELLSPELTEAFFTPQVVHRIWEDECVKYGLGLEFILDSTGQVIFCDKTGVNVGNSGEVRYYPQEEIQVVVLSNMENRAWAPINKVYDVLSEQA